VLVAGDQLGALGARQDRLGFRRLAGLARLDLDDLDRAKSQRPTRRGRALGVVTRQRSLGRRA
jgi:hypothetical protein